MEQEAFILARSQFNNTLWIDYLCNDINNKRLKEYFYQPHISMVKYFENIKKLLYDYKRDIKQEYIDKIPIEELNNKLQANKKILKSEGYDINKLHNKSIFALAKQNAMLFGTYIAFYCEASKFEHSDISSTKKYRKKIIEEYSNEQVFTIDLSTSDIELWKVVFNYSLNSYFFGFNAIYEKLQKNQPLYFNEDAYNLMDFQMIILKFEECRNLLDSLK